jgi:hypothetical protein
MLMSYARSINSLLVCSLEYFGSTGDYLPWLGRIRLILIYRHRESPERGLRFVKNPINGFCHLRLQKSFSALLTHTDGNIL